MNETLSLALSEHRFLHGLTPEQVVSLVPCARTFRAPAGSYLFREGAPADTCYLLQGGQVAIEIHAPRRGTVLVQTIAPGDIVGWSWLITPYIWQFDARAGEDVQAIALDGPGLRERMASDHDLGFQLSQRLIGVVGNRLAATRLQLLDVYK